MGIETDIDKMYSEASILLNASESEGFGNSILEALSYSIPVLAVDDKYFGISKLVKNNINGIKCSKEEFRKNLIMLIRNEELIYKLSSKCKDSISEYDEKIILPKWLNMLEDAKNE